MDKLTLPTLLAWFEFSSTRLVPSLSVERRTQKKGSFENLPNLFWCNLSKKFQVTRKWTIRRKGGFTYHQVCHFVWRKKKIFSGQKLCCQSSSVRWKLIENKMNLHWVKFDLIQFNKIWECREMKCTKMCKKEMSSVK